MRVLFYGTPDFAVPSLTALVGEGFDVVGVVTRPDKPIGRHHSSTQPSPVKRAALAEDLPVLQPDDPSAADFLERIAALKPDIAAVVAYGHILKPNVLAVPRLGSVNVHASLLPKLRGAAPIERAILEGFSETGVTIMQMDAGMDTGPILHQVATPLPPDETAGELRVRLAEIGALALVEALTLMEESTLPAVPQNDALATMAPKLTRAEERLDWSQPAELVARKIRAFDPKPGAWTELNGKALKVYGGVEEGTEGKDGEEGRERGEGKEGKEGTVVGVGEVLRVMAGGGIVQIAEVQPAGKQRMSVQSFVNGRGVAGGDVLV